MRTYMESGYIIIYSSIGIVVNLFMLFFMLNLFYEGFNSDNAKWLYYILGTIGEWLWMMVVVMVARARAPKDDDEH